MTITTQADSFGGTYYTVHTDTARSEFFFPVGHLESFDSFLCSYREEPFFMSAKAGNSVDEIPKETQWLGIRHLDGSYSVLFSLAFEACRTCFFGKDGQLWCAAVTGDDSVREQEFCAWYQISGRDFYGLVERAAKSVTERFGTCRLRTEKKTPACMDFFGWCTWDSFYDLVAGTDIPRGLESFRKGGTVPKLLILDDGWQTTGDQELSRGRWKLSSLGANEKFAPALKNTVDRAKALGVEKCFVWHAILGYWGGIDPNSPEMAKYGPVLSKGVHTRQIREVNPARWESEHFDFGMIEPARAGAFYDDYHRYLRSQGVDGVKVDVQSAVEAHGQGRGGRVKLTRMIREALEGSVERHFVGELINCMSNANDMVYHCRDSNLMRSSNDFFPEEPLSHSEHIYRNAVNSIWLSQFVWCDWDMFQTSHPYGSYHAAARAISGGPVYVSDRVDAHNFDLIRALTDREGKTLRAKAVGLPTEDCLFADPRAKKTLYKIFNRNAYGSVIGVFAFGGEKQTVAVSPSDIPGSTDGTYGVYSHKTGKTALLSREETLEVSLEGMEWDILTVSKMENGFAVLGLTEKLNSGGAVELVEHSHGQLYIKLADEGHLLICTEKEGFQTLAVPPSGEVRYLL